MCFDDDYGGYVSDDYDSDSDGLERTYTTTYTNEFHQVIGGEDIHGNIYNKKKKKIGSRYVGQDWWYDEYGTRHMNDEEDFRDRL